MSKQTTEEPVFLSKATPSTCADIFRTKMRPHLINQQSEWLDYLNGAYVSIEDATIMAEIKRFTDRARIKTLDDATGKYVTSPFNPRPADQDAIYKELARECHVPANTRSPPCWLQPSRTDPKPRDIISCRNGLLDIKTGKLHPHTPRFFTRTALPIDYDPQSPVPTRFLSFLAQAMKDREPLIELLQEMIGYVLSGDQSHQKVFFLWGPPRSGKGTLLRVVTALAGPLNCHNPSIQTLAGRFGLQGCLAKSVVKITDLDTDDKQALGAAATRINAISGEDDVAVERKGITDWNGRLPGRIIMAANNLPNFGGHSVALATRLLIVPFDVSFVGREDRELTEKLLAELPAILNWALAGLARLNARGRFAEPDDSAVAKLRMLYQSEPVRGFVEECCTLEIGAIIDKAILYPRYQEYCRIVGAHPMAMHKFSERLSAIFPTTAASKRRASNDTRPPIFTGVKLNDVEALRVFRLDPELHALGEDGAAAILLDVDGQPVPRAAAVYADD